MELYSRYFSVTSVQDIPLTFSNSNKDRRDKYIGDCGALLI